MNFPIGSKNDSFKIFLKVTNEISKQSPVVLEGESQGGEREAGETYPDLNPRAYVAEEGGPVSHSQ